MSDLICECAFKWMMIRTMYIFSIYTLTHGFDAFIDVRTKHSHRIEMHA